MIQRWCVLGVLLGLVAWSCVDATEHLLLFRELRSRSVPERGALAVDPQRNFLALAGRMRMRRQVREAEVPEFAGPVVWRWAFEQSLALPSDARVRIDAPLFTLYLYAVFFFHPAAVELGGRPGIVANRDSFLRNLRSAGPDGPPDDPGRYTHRLVALPGGALALLPFRAGGRGGP